MLIKDEVGGGVDRILVGGRGDKTSLEGINLNCLSDIDNNKKVAPILYL
jgi:hypothetical protein